MRWKARQNEGTPPGASRTQVRKPLFYLKGERPRGLLRELLGTLKLLWELPNLRKGMKRVQRMRIGKPFPKRKTKTKKKRPS